MLVISILCLNIILEKCHTGKPSNSDGNKISRLSLLSDKLSSVTVLSVQIVYEFSIIFHFGKSKYDCTIKIIPIEFQFADGSVVSNRYITSPCKAPIPIEITESGINR